MAFIFDFDSAAGFGIAIEEDKEADDGDDMTYGKALTLIYSSPNVHMLGAKTLTSKHMAISSTSSTRSFRRAKSSRIIFLLHRKLTATC
jgi:hypothetical protein